MTFPKTPLIKLTRSDDQELPDTSFLKVERDKQTFVYPDDSSSAPTTVDRITRRSMDVVVILAWYKENKLIIGENKRFVYLRSAVRPPVILRDFTPSGVLEEADVGNMWELPAGLVDSHEYRIEGIKQAAARELHEEAGFVVDPERLAFLGKRTFSSAGTFAERLFFLSVEVDPAARQQATLDGSPFEAHGEVVAVSLSDAMDAIRQGYIYDAKTEIALRRFNSFY